MFSISSDVGRALQNLLGESTAAGVLNLINISITVFFVLGAVGLIVIGGMYLVRKLWATEKEEEEASFLDKHGKRILISSALLFVFGGVISVVLALFGTIQGAFDTETQSTIIQLVNSQLIG